MLNGKSDLTNQLSKLEALLIREYQEDAGIVGEEANIGSTFHILVTKDFNREYRLHEAIISLTGAGKSTLAEGLIKPFREYRKEDIIDVVRMTGPALERYESLDGKILLLSQSVGTEPTSIRPLLSEGKLGLMITERNETSNRFEAKVVQKDGMPVFITTSTDPNIDPELLRRVVQRTVDESAEQTKRIKEKQAKDVSTIRLPRIARFKLSRAILEQIDKERPKNIDQVVIPYAKEIESKLPDEVEIRSKLPQFLRLIQSIAIVKAVCLKGYHLLKAEKTRPARVVIATIEDFNDALFMAGASFFHLVPATAQAIIDFLALRTTTVKNGVKGGQFIEREEYEKCTIREIQEKLKINASTIAKYANKLADQGLILKDKTTKGDSKVELNLYQYLPNTIIDTGLELKDFDYDGWHRKEIVDKGYILSELKLESALELALYDDFSQIRHTSDSCVNIGQTPTITHESDIPRIETRSTTEVEQVVESSNSDGFCQACDTSYGSGYREHIQLAHKGADPNIASK